MGWVRDRSRLGWLGLASGCSGQVVAYPVVVQRTPRVASRARVTALASSFGSCRRGVGRACAPLRPPWWRRSRVREFAFNLRLVGSVVGLPGRVLLAGAGVLQPLLVPADRDRAPAGGR